MPNEDETGPRGQGPLTGRKLGTCNGANGNPNSPRLGLGGGRGMRVGPRDGRGDGRGMGRGFGRGFVQKFAVGYESDSGFNQRLHGIESDIREIKAALKEKK